MAKILCVLYADPVEGYPTSYPRDDLPRLDRYPDGQTLPNPRTTDFEPGALLYFGNFAGVTLENTAVPLRQFADQYACPMELLLSANGLLTLPTPIHPWN